MRGFLSHKEPKGAGGAVRGFEPIAVDAAGEVVEFWGFKRNQGRVWALLYLRGRAHTAREIQADLGLSKGAVSMIVRDLERWGVLHRERARGAWTFGAEPGLMEMVARVLREREAVLVSRVRQDLDAAEKLARSDPQSEKGEIERLRRMRRLADLAYSALTVFLQTARLDARGFMSVLAAGIGKTSKGAMK